MDQMKATAVGEEGLEAAVERFERWRQARRRGEHIPPELWAAAMSLSTRHGTHRVAEALGLNTDRLLRRLRDADAQASPTTAADPAPDLTADFVQMLVASPEVEAGAARASIQTSTAALPCVLELRNARGATLRMELPAPALAILPALCAAFGGA
jgi:hypothetical protein